MSMQTLPDKIFCKIGAKVAKDYWWLLGLLLRADKRGREIVYRKEVLKDANIFSMCSEPEDIAPDVRNRKIFSACFDAGNTTAFYYEDLRLVTRCGDIEGAIKILQRNVPRYEDATFAVGILSICAGDSKNGGMYLVMLANEEFGLKTEEVRELGDELIRELWMYSPPYKNTYKDLFKFPDTDIIKAPECGMHCGLEYGPYDNKCNNCYLWWCAVRIANML